MKGLFVLSTLFGVVLSTTVIDQCDTDICDSGHNSGPILFKSKHNVSKVANITSQIKNMHYMSVGGDGHIMMDTNEEAGTYIKCHLVIK